MIYCPRQMMECGAQGCRCSMAVHRYTRNAYTSWLPRELSPLYSNQDAENISEAADNEADE